MPERLVLGKGQSRLLEKMILVTSGDLDGDYVNSGSEFEFRLTIFAPRASKKIRDDLAEGLSSHVNPGTGWIDAIRLGDDYQLIVELDRGCDDRWLAIDDVLGMAPGILRLWAVTTERKIYTLRGAERLVVAGFETDPNDINVVTMSLPGCLDFYGYWGSSKELQGFLSRSLQRFPVCDLAVGRGEEDWELRISLRPDHPLPDPHITRLLRTLAQAAATQVRLSTGSASGESENAQLIKFELERPYASPR